MLVHCSQPNRCSSFAAALLLALALCSCSAHAQQPLDIRQFGAKANDTSSATAQLNSAALVKAFAFATATARANGFDIVEAEAYWSTMQDHSRAAHDPGERQSAESLALLLLAASQTVLVPAGFTFTIGPSSQTLRTFCSKSTAPCSCRTIPPSGVPLRG